MNQNRRPEFFIDTFPDGDDATSHTPAPQPSPAGAQARSNHTAPNLSLALDARKTSEMAPLPFAATTTTTTTMAVAMRGGGDDSSAAAQQEATGAGYAYYEQGGDSGAQNGAGARTGTPTATEIAIIMCVIGGVLLLTLGFFVWRSAQSRRAGKAGGEGSGSDDQGAAATAATASDASRGGGAAVGGGGGGGPVSIDGLLDDNLSDASEHYGNTTIITAGPNPFRDPPNCHKPLPKDKPLPPKAKDSDAQTGAHSASGSTVALVEEQGPEVRAAVPDNWVGPVGDPHRRGGRCLVSLLPSSSSTKFKY